MHIVISIDHMPALIKRQPNRKLVGAWKSEIGEQDRFSNLKLNSITHLRLNKVICEFKSIFGDMILMKSSQKLLTSGERIKKHKTLSKNICQ